MNLIHMLSTGNRKYILIVSHYAPKAWVIHGNGSIYRGRITDSTLFATSVPHLDQCVAG